jgi:hypothetical protein
MVWLSRQRIKIELLLVLAIHDTSIVTCLTFLMNLSLYLQDCRMCNPDDLDPRRADYDVDALMNPQTSGGDLASTILTMIQASSCEAFHSATQVIVSKDDPQHTNVVKDIA